MFWYSWFCWALAIVVALDLKVNAMLVSLRGLGQVQGLSEAGSYAYLGIPYAKPPIGNLRFMPPERHDGWNRTLDATSYPSNCHQITARGRTSEDCLYMNIWTPQQYGGLQRSTLPVLIFIGGELYSSYDSSLFSGAELASSSDIIVVSFNYRLGVFGFFSLEDSRAGGNMGLQDQYLAIEWVHENIREFGGDPLRVTLMGHSAGAASAVFHMTSPRAASSRFSRIILMSGTSIAPWAMGYKVKEASERFASELGCGSKNVEGILTCLRFQDVNRLTQTAYRVIDYFNGTEVFGPVVDSFLPQNLQYVSRSPWEALERGDFPRIPVITGVSSKDGLLMIKRRSQFFRMTPLQLKETFETSLISELLERSRLNRNWLIVKEVVKFAFITGASNETEAVMDQMLDFFTEANFLAPHIHTAQLLAKHSNPVYAYVFDQETPDPNIDPRSSINTTGAGHGSILFYLFGRTTFMDQIGRDYNGVERAISMRIQELWSNFAKSGIPSQARSHSWSSWSKFSPTEPIHYWLRDGRVTARGYQPYRTQFWTEFLPTLNQLSFGPNGFGYGSAQEYREGASPVYKSATWTLVGLVLILVAVLLLVFNAFRKRKKEQDFTSRETSPEAHGSRSPLPSPSPHPGRSARRPRTHDPGVTILY